jgi:HEAT repeats
MPSDQQLDLFAASGFLVDPATPPARRSPPVAPSDLDDAALVAAIADAGLATCQLLVEEAGRRHLAAAIPALEALCRRFKGFGLEHAVPEQIAALQGLVTIGGTEAAAAVVRIITGLIVQGPGVSTAVAAAAELRCRLPLEIAMVLLRHSDPGVRCNAARCAPPRQEAITLLTDLLHDLNKPVAAAAACALGRMGRAEARPALLRLLLEVPSPLVIEAIIPIADADCIVLLGRIARARPALNAAVVAALDGIDDDRAASVASMLRLPAESLR